MDWELGTLIPPYTSYFDMVCFLIHVNKPRTIILPPFNIVKLLFKMVEWPWCTKGVGKQAFIALVNSQSFICQNCKWN